MAAGGLENVLGFYACLLLWTFLVYSLANLSFGMINTIPNRVLVWIGDKKVQVLPAKPVEERLSGRTEPMMVQAGPPAQTLAPPPAPVVLPPSPPPTVSITHVDGSKGRSQKSIPGPDDKPTDSEHAKHIPKL